MGSLRQSHGNCTRPVAMALFAWTLKRGLWNFVQGQLPRLNGSLKGLIQHRLKRFANGHGTLPSLCTMPKERVLLGKTKARHHQIGSVLYCTIVMLDALQRTLRTHAPLRFVSD